MTKLSIFLWLADTISGLNTFFVIIAVTCLIGGAFIAFALDELDMPSWIPKVLIPIGLISAFIACVIPEKKTIYMIAGVELANSVMESEDFGKVKNYLGTTGVEMLDDIKAIIHAEAETAIEKAKDKK